MELDFSKFKKPGKEYRGVPFWSLNDLLEDEELKWQIAEMDEKGFGGFFLHAREILITPYLSKDWMDRLETCIKEAEKRGMYAWLYDEDRWPSGFAGGMVPALSKEYRAKALMMHISNRLYKVCDAIKVFKADLVNGKIKNVEEVKEGEEEELGKVYLYFVPITANPGERWHGNFCYIDTLNPEAVKAFIEVTYEAYYKRFGKWFGKVIPGIFTDEPNISSSRPMYNFSVFQRGARYPAYFLPWTDRLPEYFKRKYGYDILEHLPSLFFDVGDYHKVRLHYWRAVTELFLEAYTKQVYEWCDKHNLKYTGHYLAEESLISQLKCIGAAMPHYEFMHIPGVDHLRRDIREHLTIKQVTSVANQLGKERVLSETYGGSGQNLSFEDRKWIGDWEYVLGINLLNHHLCLYSMRGARKRDYPPNLFWQQPWWKYNRLIEDYFTRLSYILSLGKRIVDILVLHPITSAWACYTPLSEEKVKELDKAFQWIVKTLLDLKLDYELGDELIIERHGRIEGNKFIIGRCSYSIVVIPPSVTLLSKTFELLKEFARNGGKIIAFKPLPYLVDGVPSDELTNFLKKYAVIIDSLDEKKVLEAFKDYEKRVDVLDKEGNIIKDVWYHLREVGNYIIVFLTNLSRDKDYEAVVKIKYKGYVEEWNAFNGERKVIPSEYDGKYTILKLDFPSVGSHLIVIDTSKEPVKVEEEKYTVHNTIKLGDEWKYEMKDPNALLLDYCKVKIIEPAFYKPIEYDKVPTWKAHNIVHSAGIGTEFVLTFEFESLIEGKNKDVYLVVECPEKYEIKVNDVPVEYRDEGWWIDKSFKKIKISDFIKRGINKIELKGKVDFDTEIESCYIIGNFAVENINDLSFKIKELPEKVKGEDLVYEGFPFFAGTFKLIQEVEIPEVTDKVELEIDEFNTIVANVIVNGKEVGQIFKKPYKIDITKYVKKGKNVIEIELVSSLRNLLGPHHHKKGELFSVGPESFKDEANWTDKYNFVKFGIRGAKINLLKKVK